MNFSQDILMILLISIIASATGTDLATNTNILLILLLALVGLPSNNTSTCNTCSGRLLF